MGCGTNQRRRQPDLPIVETPAKQIDNQMSYSAPRLLAGSQSAVSDHLAQQSFNWDLALKVKITYQVTDYSFNCDMILFIPESAINNIKSVIDRILEEF